MGGKPGARHAAFDGQARDFDARAGLGEQACRKIASALVDLAQAGRIVEVGAGSGEIGAWLHAGSPAYLGFDSSSAMLEIFRSRAPGVSLHLADAHKSWPVADGTARLVFGSRILHLLDQQHVAAEFLRTTGAGAYLAIGRVHIDRASMKARMRRRMRWLMHEGGLDCRAGESARETLVAACVEAGAQRLPHLKVVSWQVSQRARDSLESWRGKRGLGGSNPAPLQKANILAALESWAKKEFGGLDEEHVSEESYVLTLVRR